MKETFEERVRLGNLKLKEAKESGKTINLTKKWSEKSLESLSLALRGGPCKFDHNGECLICDAWPEHCGYDRLIRGDFEFENFDELMVLFSKHLTEEQKTELKNKYGKEN